MTSSFNKRAFQSLGALRNLNVIAVGLSLAAATAGVFAHFMGTGSQVHSIGIFVGLPTLIVGMMWAAVLRLRATMGQSKFRWGWAASVPFAGLNGALACGFMLAGDTHGYGSVFETFMLGALLGATIGALFWIPGLIATLVCFGIPIAWSQKQAEKGLAGEERGEIVIGAASTLIALFGALLLLGTKMPDEPKNALLETIGMVFMWLTSLGGALTGGTAALLALKRQERRKQFVKEVEAGQVAGYRVDAVPEGKVLVRVTSIGQGYRVANFEEALVTLDDEGEAKKTLRAS